MESEHVRHEVYQIVVKGHLDSEWSDWFDGLTITLVGSGGVSLGHNVTDAGNLSLSATANPINQTAGTITVRSRNGSPSIAARSISRSPACWRTSNHAGCSIRRWWYGRRKWAGRPSTTI